MAVEQDRTPTEPDHKEIIDRPSEVIRESNVGQHDVPDRDPPEFDDDEE